MTIAAIYARKSTEQSGVADDQKSVARQRENALAFAAEKGWVVPDQHVYTDDAISGAETRKLLNRQRLIDAVATGRASFQVLIMCDASRFSRLDGDEAFGELKRIAQSGVEIWFYQEGTQFTYGNFAANITGFVRAEVNAEYRRQIGRWTREAMVRKAKAGHVTGGRVFGYDNVEVLGPNGQRSHVERRINKEEAAIVRQIFEMAASGSGFTAIAKSLNERRAPSPRPQQGRPGGWAPSSVREVLHRPLYRGEVVYYKTKKRNDLGQTQPTNRPAADWISVPAPNLSVVPSELWSAAHAQMDRQRARVHKSPHGGVPWSAETRYLFSGLLRCSTCGAGFEARSRSHGAQRVAFYGCSAYHRRGRTVCSNSRTTPLALADPALLSSVESALLDPAVLRAAVQRAVERLSTPRVQEPVEDITQRIAALDRDLRQLEAAVIAGGADVQTLVTAMRTRETERRRLVEQLRPPVPFPIVDSTAVLREC